MLRLRHAWLGIVALVLAFAPSARAADPKLLPAETEWVFNFNLKQMLESELVKANRETLDQLIALAKANAPADGGAEKFLKAADFDPFRDMISFSIAGPAGVEADQLVIIVEGKFKADKVHAAANEFAKAAGEAVKISKIGGVTVYEVAVPGEKAMFLSLVDDKNLVASAAKESLTEVIQRATGAKKAGLKKDFRALLDTTSPRQSISFAATGNALTVGVKNAPKIPKGDKVAEILGDVQGVAASITIKKDIDFQLNVTTTDKDKAESLAQAADFGLGVVKAMVQGKADMDPKAKLASDVLSTLKVASKGSDIVITGRVTVEVLERIFQNLGN